MRPRAVNTAAFLKVIWGTFSATTTTTTLQRIGLRKNISHYYTNWIRVLWLEIILHGKNLFKLLSWLADWPLKRIYFYTLNQLTIFMYISVGKQKVKVNQVRWISWKQFSYDFDIRFSKTRFLIISLSAMLTVVHSKSKQNQTKINRTDTAVLRRYITDFQNLC